MGHTAVGVLSCSVEAVAAVLAFLGVLTALTYGAVRFYWEWRDRHNDRVRRELEEQRAAEQAEVEARRAEAERLRADAPRLETFNLVDMRREAQRLENYEEMRPPSPPWSPRRGNAAVVVGLALILTAAVVVGALLLL